jgi:hypothetical protein
MLRENPPANRLSLGIHAAESSRSGSHPAGNLLRGTRLAALLSCILFGCLIHVLDQHPRCTRIWQNPKWC